MRLSSNLANRFLLVKAPVFELAAILLLFVLREQLVARPMQPSRLSL